MKKERLKLAAVIVGIILAGIGLILFIRCATNEVANPWFEGTVLENTGDYIIIRIDPAYEKELRLMGETVKLAQKDKTVGWGKDFTKFPVGDRVRVVYATFNAKEKRLNAPFSIYTMEEVKGD